jgi:NitT/TauT family transport system permease protein
VNATAGLAEASPMERGLMHGFAATYRQEMQKLRLPAALPFVFNALKLNSTLAMIGAIVAEFFGTPIVGMGFRISTEAARMNLDVVWAEIAMAAVSGGALFAGLALAERAVTFWHASFRNA